MTSHPCSPAKLEPLLRDACRRALRFGLSFPDQLRLYRSIIALAREVRLMFGGQAPQIGDPSLPALLASVCDRACDLGLDPTLPLPDAILLHRLATGLSRAARQAEGGVAVRRRLGTKNPLQRETVPNANWPAAPSTLADRQRSEPLPSNEPLHREPEKMAEDPMHPEPVPPDDAPDDSLSVWRNDHKTERDRNAHEKFRTVMEDRVLSKIRAENRRLRTEAESMPPASPASATAPPYGAGFPPPAAGFEPASAHPPAPLAAE